ncbi:antitoxin VbhA family protein [Paenibacillus jiagnxiensis]|uniref:antitoxin VbhA family protein n=1 Tax=Paenibacillus jiagnxiensis TaxID=3228926 RepID=UPI0033A6B9F6
MDKSVIIIRAIKYATATLAIEGRVLSEDAQDLIKRQMQGELTEQEFLNAALRRVME